MDQLRRLVVDIEALREVIEVMALLRGPGGCPWDVEQTHESLVPYAIEEAHEVAQAIESGTSTELKEELGDLLLQVLFHSQIAAENAEFTIADVASTLTRKLRRRHPHVFGEVQASTPEEVERNWEAIKREENPDAQALEGIPVSLPALMRAQKVISRANKAGMELPLPVPASAAPVSAQSISAESIGEELLAVVAKAQAERIDAEQALRMATQKLLQKF